MSASNLLSILIVSLIVDFVVRPIHAAGDDRRTMEPSSVDVTQSRQISTCLMILIVVFLVHQIQAADDDMTMMNLSGNLAIMSNKAAKKTMKALTDGTRLTPLARNQFTRNIWRRLLYVPMHSPLTLTQLLRGPDPGSSRAHMTYVMAYHAHQYESCKTHRVMISNTLDFDGRLQERSKISLREHSKTLAVMMKHYLSLEVNYGIELGIVAQHIQPLFTTQEETGHGKSTCILACA
ncbi:hypothetical protein SeMB42_g01713 [Synchytrium endobioticum]|uniref:Uncharacterized protein n=1 Tax=Synchytrium endobioticum TaxID=286115 RepID=A0A507DM91_9FUNG|nr:hypothetical protein SeMB42_g01713 [Synchytrium endobioticum]